MSPVYACQLAIAQDMFLIQVFIIPSRNWNNVFPCLFMSCSWSATSHWPIQIANHIIMHIQARRGAFPTERPLAVICRQWQKLSSGQFTRALLIDSVHRSACLFRATGCIGGFITMKVAYCTFRHPTSSRWRSSDRHSTSRTNQSE